MTALTFNTVYWFDADEKYHPCICLAKDYIVDLNGMVSVPVLCDPIWVIYQHRDIE